LDMAVVLTVGKYVFLACLYGFVLAVFRRMMRQLIADEDATGVAHPRRAAPRAGRRSAALSQAAEPPLPWPAPGGREVPVEPAQEPAAGPRLVVVESHEGQPPVGTEFPLSAAVTIGRNEENAITLDDRYVSGNHALICLREGRRILVDRGSTNGTLVNGHQVEAEVELAGGDHVSVGRTVFEYHAS